MSDDHTSIPGIVHGVVGGLADNLNAGVNIRTVGSINTVRGGSPILPVGVLEILDEALKNLTLIAGALNEIDQHIEGPADLKTGEGSQLVPIGLRGYANEVRQRTASLAQIARAIREKL